MGAVKDEIYKCETCGNVVLVLEGGDGESRWEKGGTLFSNRSPLPKSVISTKGRSKRPESGSAGMNPD